MKITQFYDFDYPDYENNAFIAHPGSNIDYDIYHVKIPHN